VRGGELVPTSDQYKLKRKLPGGKKGTGEGELNKKKRREKRKKRYVLCAQKRRALSQEESTKKRELLRQVLQRGGGGKRWGIGHRPKKEERKKQNGRLHVRKEGKCGASRMSNTKGILRGGGTGTIEKMVDGASK